MTEDLFWQIVQQTLAARAAAQPKRLGQELRRLSPEQLYDFLRMQGVLLARSRNRLLWMAAGLLNGAACGGRCFDSFRFWLISLGKEFYVAAVAEPDGLALAETGFDPERGEAFANVPAELMELGDTEMQLQEVAQNRLMTSEELPIQDKPIGLNYWDKPSESELKETLPRLWAKFGAAYQRGDAIRIRPDRLEFVRSLSIKGIGAVTVGQYLNCRRTGESVLVEGLAIDRNDYSPETYVVYVVRHGLTQREPLTADRFSIE